MAVTPEETLATLRARAAASRARAAETAEAARSCVAGEVQARLPAGARCWLIGSLAWGGFGNRSDVDIVLDGWSDAEALALELALSARLGVPADVLALRELPDAFRERVLREGIALHGR